MAYVVNVNDPTTPTNSQGAKQGAEELRAIKLKLQAIVAGAVITTAAGANAADVQTFIQPSIEDRPAISAGGWLPWNLNQQWGGAPMPVHMVDSATGVEYKFDAFDQFIEDNASAQAGVNAATFYNYQVITPAKNLSLQAIWFKLCKSGNPVDNATVKLWSVAAGLPNALIATANVINGKQITSDSNGQWYRFSFAAVQALVAGTQYIATFEKSGGVDAANFYILKGVFVAPLSRYPNNLSGVGTAAPVWTAQNTFTRNFICEAQASDQIVQSGGQFTGRIVGSEGNPINRSVAYNKPLREFFPLFHPNGWSILIRGKSWTKDKTIFEALFGGLHHDRINVRSAVGTGFTTVTVYESDNTVTTVTGNTDISAATYKDILIVGRSLNDAGDYIKIYTGINNVWTKEAESTGLSLIFDPLMLKQGTGWLMGGFRLFANTDYTKLSDMTILPSGDGWTFTTTSATVEGNVFAVSNGKLNQIKAGMAAGGDGFYVKTGIALSNVNGWATAWKARVGNSTNTFGNPCPWMEISDTVKQISVNFHEFYLQALNGALSGSAVQGDNKSNDAIFLSTSKGSDNLIFRNGAFVFDGTGAMSTATADATGRIRWGDISVTANENADVTWDYLGYYNTASIYPQFTSGELHEFAVFSGDKNVLAQAIYNLGIPLSIKSYCGIQKNYVNSVVQEFTQCGITIAISTASGTPVLMEGMEYFALGNNISVQAYSRASNDTPGASFRCNLYMDGKLFNNTIATTSDLLFVAAGANYEAGQTHVTGNIPTNYGLHKIERRFWAGGGTSTSPERARVMAIRAESK